MQPGPERLRDWIKRSQCNQTQAADILGITPVFLSQLLSGDRTPGLANAIKIEHITGIAAESWMLNPISESDQAVTAGRRERKR